jgi:CRP/FNR family cyclic AMP-dependent transcriptional regulator
MGFLRAVGWVVTPDYNSYPATSTSFPAFMDDMDFTKPQPAAAPAPVAAPSAPFKPSGSPFYDSAVAAQIFKASGRSERFAAGTRLFAEDEKATAGGLFSMRTATRMYFIAEGQIALSIGGKPLDTVGPGEVFGEMAVITERPRSATATTRSDCAVYSMSREELNGALAHHPEFALMLMSVVFDRLRFVTARFAARNIALRKSHIEPPVFDVPLLQSLETALPRSATTRYRQESVIMREGQKGAYMYVVKTGTVAISVRDKEIAVIASGGTFGEMALVDQSLRSATAVATTECELLSLDRASLIEAVKVEPEFAMAMLRVFADRVRKMNALLA